MLVGGATCHPLQKGPLVKRGRKKKTKGGEEAMGSGGSGAEFRLVRIVVAALSDRLADAAAVVEEEEVAILLASKAIETGMGRACGSTVLFWGGSNGFF